MRILIVDDDLSFGLLLEKAIKKMGHECLVALDGIQGWQLFQSNEIDAVISDCKMPGMDGIELCRKVRQNGAAPYTYFIFLSVLGDHEHCLAGLKVGADDYLSKPLNFFELQARLLVATRVTSLHRELAEHKSELERLYCLSYDEAHRDPLTQLGNRLRLQKDLVSIQDQIVRYKHSFCVALCDIDFFKPFNDYYGHLAGDNVLRVVAQTIEKSMRSCDMVYRYGGEEFLIILPEQSLATGTIAVERLLRAVEAQAIPHVAKKPAGVLTISAGIAALSPSDGKTMEGLLKEADRALYHAKASGRNRVSVHSSELPQNVVFRDPVMVQAWNEIK
jgi:two-component system, cell cycle response regulator